MNTAILETVLAAGGDEAITTAGVHGVGDAFLVLYDDGTNSYLATVETAAGAGAAETFASGDLTITNLVNFNGVADADDFTKANFAFV